MGKLGAVTQGKTIQDRPLYWHYPHYGNQGGGTELHYHGR